MTVCILARVSSIMCIKNSITRPTVANQIFWRFQMCVYMWVCSHKRVIRWYLCRITDVLRACVGSAQRKVMLCCVYALSTSLLAFCSCVCVWMCTYAYNYICMFVCGIYISGFMYWPCYFCDAIVYAKWVGEQAVFMKNWCWCKNVTLLIWRLLQSAQAHFYRQQASAQATNRKPTHQSTLGIVYVCMYVYATG